MTTATLADRRALFLNWDWRLMLPRLCAGFVFVVLFWTPIDMLVRDWWSNPDAGHGLLLAPLAAYLAWKRGLITTARPQPALGALLLVLAIVLRYVSGLAVEWFLMRASMLLALAAVVVFWFGMRQLVYWWLPALLLTLSIPLPEVVLASLALPLQFKASQMGAALLEWRHVPVYLAGNVIHIPGRSLFVTEACSGLRSLTSLISLGVLIGGLWLRSPVSRVALVLAAIPVAVLLNGIRVFLTGFLVFFVDPKLGEGFMHMTEGWIIFAIAFAVLGGFAWLAVRVEELLGRAAA